MVEILEQHAWGGSGRTEADGTFRFAVRANRSAKSTYDTVRVRKGGHIWSEVPPTVFLADPTTLSPSVPVREREETAGLELRVSTSPHYRVTVTLRDEAGGSIVNPTIAMFHGNWTGNPRVGPDNRVTVGPLPRGPMTVLVTADTTNGMSLAGMTTVDVVDGPVDDAVVALVPSARVRGRVEFADGDWTSRARPAMRVLSTIPGRSVLGYSSNDPNGRVAWDGHFTLTGLVGPRCLVLSDIPRGYRMGAILRDGRDITAEPIDFGPDQQVEGVIIRLEAGETVDRTQPRCNSR
jgi:hypothetical protein